MPKREKEKKVKSTRSKIRAAVCKDPLLPGAAVVIPGAAALGNLTADCFVVKKLKDADGKPVAFVAEQDKRMEGMYIQYRAGLTVNSDASTSYAHSKQAIAVYNKSKGTLRVLGVCSGQPLLVLADGKAVPGPDDAAAVADKRPQGELDAAARRLQNKMLVDAFGSTRRKRQLQARDEGTVRTSQLVNSSAIQAALNTVNASALAAGLTRDEVLLKAGTARNIPAHNPTACKPHQAYALSQMFDAVTLAAVKPGLLLKAADDSKVLQDLKSKEKVPEYVLCRLNLLRNQDLPDKKRVGMARLLTLLGALLQLHSKRNGRLRSTAGAEGLEKLAKDTRIGRRDLLEPLLDKFYSHSHEAGVDVYTRDDSQRELLLGHALILALDVEGWKLAPEQFDQLRQQLKLRPQELAVKFKTLGCTAKSAKLASLEDATAYLVTLLQEKTDPPKQLKDCFPSVNPMGGGKRMGR